MYFALYLTNLIILTLTKYYMEHNMGRRYKPYFGKNYFLCAFTLTINWFMKLPSQATSMNIENIYMANIVYHIIFPPDHSSTCYMVAPGIWFKDIFALSYVISRTDRQNSD
jgi:hypothetical protein